jgi:hypothetical protein
LNYAVFREHSARTGRFLMPDPVRGNVRNPQRLNRFIYVMGNPTNRTDPRGLDGVIGFGPITSSLPYESSSGASGASNYSHNIHPLGGFPGAAEGWHQEQDALRWLSFDPIGCWDASGFRDPTCVISNSNGLISYLQDDEEPPPPSPFVVCEKERMQCKANCDREWRHCWFDNVALGAAFGFVTGMVAGAISGGTLSLPAAAGGAFTGAVGGIGTAWLTCPDCDTRCRGVYDRCLERFGIYIVRP